MSSLFASTLKHRYIDRLGLWGWKAYDTRQNLRNRFVLTGPILRHPPAAVAALMY